MDEELISTSTETTRGLPTQSPGTCIIKALHCTLPRRESGYVQHRHRCAQPRWLANSLAYLSLPSCPASVICLSMSWYAGGHLETAVFVLLLSCRKNATLWVPCVPLS